jgi:hypothetical protein
MTYAVLYARNGDFIADFDSQEEAVEALRDFVSDHPSVSEQVGIMAFDEDGHPASSFTPASALQAHRQQYA